MLYKALHNFSVGGVLFEADKLYTQNAVDAIGNPDTTEDFVEVPEAEAQEKEIGVSKPTVDPAAAEVVAEQKAAADRARVAEEARIADEKAAAEKAAAEKAAEGSNTDQNQNQNSSAGEQK